MSKPMKSKALGKVRVNSGILAIIDPCIARFLDLSGDDFFEPARRKNGLYPFNYRGCSGAAQNKDQGGQLADHEGGAGGGVAFHSGMGDGEYEVVATYKNFGPGIGERITKIEMTLIDDNFDKE